MSIEVLIPDFKGDWDALQLVIDAAPEILNHNLETVPRCYPAVRPQAKYEQSVELLKRCKEAGLVTKTGIMVGIGEKDDEVVTLMRDVQKRARPTSSPSASTSSPPATTSRSTAGSPPSSSSGTARSAWTSAGRSSRAARWSAPATTPTSRSSSSSARTARATRPSGA
ncbi:MAG: radical SAM protein [Phycisphaerales bacterium]